MKRTLQDWTDAALDSISAGGIASVSVEGLARELGVTKGSFYWHFADRSALISAALQGWEAQVAADAAARAEADEDPSERLRAYFADLLKDANSARLDVTLNANAGDDLAGPSVARVMQTRIDFAAQALRKIGLTPAQSERQARMLVASFLGHAQLSLGLSGDKYLAKVNKAYLDQLMESVAAL